MVRYPLGGNLSWALQWIVGLHGLGHRVTFLEKADYPSACFDPVTSTCTDDPSTGIGIVGNLLNKCGLVNQWCFVDFAGNYHGMSEAQVKKTLESSDLFIDMGSHGSWLGEAAICHRRVLVESEPAYTQMRILNMRREAEISEAYHAHYTNGLNIGTTYYKGPTAGIAWRHVMNPVCCELFTVNPACSKDPVTTVMNWQSHKPVSYDGKTYGQKDVEFERFIDLPSFTDMSMTIAVAGSQVPAKRLQSYGWNLVSAHLVTESLDGYYKFIEGSSAEFSVCKNIFVETLTGWFSDRSAAYLASGRPVVLQDTGFSRYLPCGEGLFAVKDAEEAAHALMLIQNDYDHHSRRARELAETYLDASIILRRFLSENGITE